VEETQDEKESKVIANMLLLWAFSDTPLRITSDNFLCLGTLWCTLFALDPTALLVGYFSLATGFNIRSPLFSAPSSHSLGYSTLSCSSSPDQI
jgi:hypothetical protein